MIGMNHVNLLKDALQGTGFVRRGSAFFRVWGDGVLQVLKFEHQRGDSVHELYIGVFSMYGKLIPDWFTSAGCIPIGNVAGFVGLWAVEGYLLPSLLTKHDGQYFYDGFPVSVDSTQWIRDSNGERWKYCFTHEQQVGILSKKVLPWLNAMTTQSLAAKAMYEIEPVLNDSLRFDAHLAAGEWTEAEQTMSAILKQHADARISWEQTFPQDQFAKLAARLEKEDIPLKAALAMVQEKDEKAISAYLSENYKKNCALAKFCMK